MNSSAARIGYARVSTADQNLDPQLAALQAARCTMVRTETGDGATLIVPGGQSISERCTASSVPLYPSMRPLTPLPGVVRDP